MVVEEPGPGALAGPGSPDGEPRTGPGTLAREPRTGSPALDREPRIGPGAPDWTGSPGPGALDCETGRWVHVVPVFSPPPLITPLGSLITPGDPWGL